eukprot:NODE_2189_length_1488_cov_110.219780_g2081_i0.p1 GENE.NODE_2189_length_1488_cov_110.219780_g2081_i0~~NODE_2189_length_1488_cov_110.219780_g2081_i0.p1  ORF type:complete len:375 (+),score=96.55 NODE_2189_length_1488_cov_110.219780_g2081_i0:63-1127(+)
MDVLKNEELAELLASSSKKKDKKTKAAALTDYKVGATLGCGSFGKVHRVIRNSDKKVFAMKTMSKHALAELDVLKWAQREQAVMEKMSATDCPFLLKLHDTIVNRSTIAMVLDFLPGGDLGFHLKKAGQMPEASARFYIAQVAMAIDHLHRHKVVYRDLKPENILLGADGNAVLADFGFADQMPEGGSTQFCGSPDYVSPEMINSDVRPYSYSVDWWSLGVTLYELLTGVVPWLDDDVAIQYDMITQNDLERRNLSDDAWALLSAMLQKNVEDRPQDLNAIKKFAFFSDFDWEGAWKRTLKPPFVPNLVESDVAYFDVDRFEEEANDKYNKNGNNKAKGGKGGKQKGGGKKKKR